MPSAVKSVAVVVNKQSGSSTGGGLVISEHLLLNNSTTSQPDHLAFSSKKEPDINSRMSPSHDSDSGIGNDAGGFTPNLELPAALETTETQAISNRPPSPVKPSSTPKPRRSSTIYSKYDQTIYLQASKIFASLEHEPRDDGSFEAAQKRKLFQSKQRFRAHIKYQSESDRVLTYGLAYTTLKYQFILEDLLEDIAFFVKYPEFSADYALVYVIFSDYMRRKFVSRELHPGERTYPEVTEVEECIVECKIKLDAALARRRIKECARSVEDLLPGSLKLKEELSNKLLTYAWVNYRKTSMTEVIEELRSCGYSVLPASSQQVSDMFFCLDNLFDDTLVFSSEQALDLGSHWLVQHGHLVIQDKTSLFGPQSMISLLNGSEDVLVLDTNAGTSAAHVSSLMKSAKRDGSVFVAGVVSPEHRSEIQSKLDTFGADNVKLIDGAIDSLEIDDVRLKNVKVVLIHGQCSKTAILDPVGFVITEGEDIAILRDLSMGKPATEKINEMTRKNLADFRYAIKFPKVQAVVYVTRSVVDAENEKIVQRAIESYNNDESRKYPFRVTPPMFNFDSKMADLRKNDKYYRHPPSEQANGCFMAIVSKEIEDLRESHQAVLERATATGLLSANSTHTGGDNLEEIRGGGDKPQKSDSTTSSKTGRKTAKLKKTSPSASKSKKLRKSASKKVAFGSTSRANLFEGSKSAK